jgi:hypothetical protein
MDVLVHFRKPVLARTDAASVGMAKPPLPDEQLEVEVVHVDSPTSFWVNYVSKDQEAVSAAIEVFCRLDSFESFSV